MSLDDQNGNRECLCVLQCKKSLEKHRSLNESLLESSRAHVAAQIAKEALQEIQRDVIDGLTQMHT